MSDNSASPAPVSNPTGTNETVNPSEVGWQFVAQYYTLINKQPSRLHCFYNKKSTFIHGTEGDDGRPCYGQQEIHQKVLSIGFQDCRVFIHSVDAQVSSNNGIIVQVIGEMYNRGEAWRKFVQTFFLAEQPNGYFVLNDIFRFLKEESVEDDEAPEVEEPQPEISSAAPTHVEPESPVAAVPATEPTPAQEPVREPTPEPEPVPASVEEPAKPQPNGLRHDAAEPKKEPEPVVEPPAPQESVREPTPTPDPTAGLAQPSPSPSPAAPAAQPAPAPAPAPQQQQQIPQQPSQPAQSAAPKTWANLAATNPKKWGSAVAQESRGMSVEAAPAPQPPSRSGTNTPVSASTGGARPGPAQKNGRVNHHHYQQALSVTSPHVFVKGLVDPIKNEDLEELLVKYGGKIKEIEFVRGSACAFVEYEDVKSAQRAIIASLLTNQGGDGGIFYKHQDGESFRVVVETKKERGERPPPRGRGGVPPQGNRGNFRGGRGRGRGVPAGKAT